MELWKQFLKYPEYEVSNEGRVRKGDLMLSLCERPDGYVGVSIRRRATLLHRVVAMVWHENPNNLPEVNHDDGIRSNCHESNLEWCTSKQNSDHKYQILGYKPKKGRKSGTGLNCDNSIQVACFDKNGQLKMVFESSLIAARHLDICPTSITNQTKKGWGTAHGLHWKKISSTKFFELEGKLSDDERYQEIVFINRPNTN